MGFDFGAFKGGGGGAAAATGASPPAAGGFGRRAGAPARAEAPSAAGPKRSAWEGIMPGRNHADYLSIGEYVVRTRSDQILERSNYWQSELEVVWAAEGSRNKVGDVGVFSQGLASAKQKDVGMPLVAAYVIAAAGFEDPHEFYAKLGGGFIDACTDGHENTPLRGRLIHVVVTMQGPRLDDAKNPVLGKDGQPDYFRGFAWDVVEEEHQDQRKQAEWFT